MSKKERGKKRTRGFLLPGWLKPGVWALDKYTRDLVFVEDIYPSGYCWVRAAGRGEWSMHFSELWQV